MLLIPYHVRNFAERVKREIQQQQVLTDTQNQTLNESWRICNEVLKIMDENNLFYELEVIELIKQLLKVVEKLNRAAKMRAMTEVSVQVELDLEMSYTGHRTSAGIKRTEVDMLLQSIRTGTEVCIGQGKEATNLIAREFKRIPSEKRWNTLIESGEVVDLTQDSSGNHLYSYIKVAYKEINDHPMFNSTPKGMARKYKAVLMEQLGREMNEEEQKAFNILCRIGKVGIYYVYIPEK